MKAVLRILGISVAALFIVVFSTATFSFIKRVWFGKGSSSSHKHVAILDVSGLMLSSTHTLRDLKEILEDSNAKAIVVRINSPGGLVAPSQEIYEALKRADRKVPVIISMGPLAASGGYYAALGGRTIYANPGTLTASIGVIMEFVNTQHLYEWAKVERFAMTAGKLKGAGSEHRPMTPEERELFIDLLQDIHRQFKAAVKERRKLTDEEIEKWADGRVMTGQQAKAAKLVDSLGTLEDAIGEAKKVAGLPDSADVVYPDTKEGLLKKLLLGDQETRFDGILQLLSRHLDAALAPGWRVMLLSPAR